MSNRDVRAACAARQCMMNDIEDFDDAIDFQFEKVHSIVRILIPDGMTLLSRLETSSWQRETVSIHRSPLMRDAGKGILRSRDWRRRWPLKSNLVVNVNCMNKSKI